MSSVSSQVNIFVYKFMNNENILKIFRTDLLSLVRTIILSYDQRYLNYGIVLITKSYMFYQYNLKYGIYLIRY